MFSPLANFDATPLAASIEMGLSDEAADMCAMWFAKYGILPSDKHIDSLSQLTGESADAIRHWFGRLMKQGMWFFASCPMTPEALVKCLSFKEFFITSRNSSGLC
jgi:hypothetical protein